MSDFNSVVTEKTYNFFLMEANNGSRLAEAILINLFDFDYTINEVREEYGLEPLIEGGETLFNRKEDYDYGED